LIPEYIEADPIAFYQLLELARAKEPELDAVTMALPDLPGLTSAAPSTASRVINLG
jgi:hypothetical protein